MSPACEVYSIILPSKYEEAEPEGDLETYPRSHSYQEVTLGLDHGFSMTKVSALRGDHLTSLEPDPKIHFQGHFK